ncbi:hypothetical protein ACFQFH_12040 [Halobaculum halobium]|uniref:Uncharacterized protein n=1 Tax=Halobaculum halobium TaxID=3032281 RepID=A0ABD5TB77_9EURY|nr:hypothetical protein [Halobaculum sp. SYNS20]
MARRAVAASLCTALFGDVLGRDPAAYDLDGRVARVRDDDGDDVDGIGI